MNKMLMAVAATSLAIPAAPLMAHDTDYRHSHRVDNGVQY